MPSTNSRIVIPYRQVADIELPREVEKLVDLAYNMWWAWTPRARSLFSSIKSDSWARYRNPVDLLLNVERSHWEQLIANDVFISSYDEVIWEFERYMNGGPETWFRRHYGDYEGGPIAYFSMEFGLHQSLAVYSGGLGVLSGDHCKSASDLDLPFVGLGLMYRAGYFRQTIDADGFQQHTYPEYDFNRLPVRRAMDARGREVVVKVPLPGRDVAVQVWVAQVGRVPLLLLDTDLVQNDPADRPVTNILYVRGREMRLIQELVLGIGGARALAALGLRPAVWHINEGHSALLQLERLRGEREAGTSGLDEALENVRKAAVFTTHTPVPAGNEQFDHALARPYIDVWGRILDTDSERLMALGNADHGEPNQPLNLTAFAMRTTTFANGVSRLNAEVADAMWRHMFPGRPAADPVVVPITNGVHLPTWLGPEIRALLERYLGADWLEKSLDPEIWQAIETIPDRELWSAHRAQKERLVRFTRSRLREQYARHGRSPAELRAVGELFNPEALTIGFARRFATYKRAKLIFSDLLRLRSLLLNADRPVQIFFAGKAHPADRPGQELIQHIYKLSQQPDLKGCVVFLENYDMRVARMLVSGTDVWLNTPRRPLEASGTSGQKAAVNGVLNCSILDGWWPEGWDGENGWAIGGTTEGAEEWLQDQEDALSLYQVLEQEVVPTFYHRDESGIPGDWLRKMKRSIATIAPSFSAGRMVRDYMEIAYASHMSLDAADGESGRVEEAPAGTVEAD